MSDITVYRSTIKGEFEAPSIGRYGGDYSFAGMFFARAAIDSSVICTNLSPLSEQSGRTAVDILREFGARITRSGDSVNVRAGKLRGIKTDISEFPKVAAVPAMLALFSTGKTCISGFKDNPALQQLIISNLRSLGARCEFNDNCLWIWPQLSPENAVLNAKDDPYVAMALILMATYTAKETTVRGIDGLLSRYPDFLTVFELLGGKYKLGTILL